MDSRDDGWALRDSDGWCRFRYCRPLLRNDLMIPVRRGVAGFPGDVRVTKWNNGVGPIKVRLKNVSGRMLKNCSVANSGDVQCEVEWQAELLK